MTVPRRTDVETEQMLAAVGVQVTDEGLDHARGRLERAEQRLTPERRAELRRVGRTAA